MNTYARELTLGHSPKRCMKWDLCTRPRLMRNRIPLRLKELRSYQNSYLRKNGIISELVDIIDGRVPKSVFTRHYLGQDMKAFRRDYFRDNRIPRENFA